MSPLTPILTGFALNLVVAIVLIGFIYYPSNRAKKEYVFTFFSFNILIYFVSGLLRDVQSTLGLGFGLLAVFTILRYRTVRIPLKEMTYLFISITVPFINTLFMATRIAFNELMLINLIIIVLIFIVEKSWGVRYLSTKTVLYEKIDLIRPENHVQMLEDLSQRTGLEIDHFEINEIDFLRDTAEVTIYHQDNSGHS
ncbi:MAG: DUF4956 domain-containing protein [Chloroflexota bacterium]